MNFRTIALVGTLALSTACGGCGDSSPKKPLAASPTPAAQTVEAKSAPSEGDAQPLGYLGVVLARQAVDVAAPTSGRLQAVWVRAGDTVAIGQALAKLDAEALANDLAVARAALREAEAGERQAQLGLSEAESRQARRLSIPESFSKEDLAQAEIQKQQAQALLESAKARVSGDRARVRQMESSLGLTEVRAPFSGQIAVRYLDPGATVGPGAPIVRLVSSNELMVRFAAPPEAARAFAPQGAIVAVSPTGSEIEGSIERVAPEVDPASRMVFVEARLRGALANLQAGSTVRVRTR